MLVNKSLCGINTFFSPSLLSQGTPYGMSSGQQSLFYYSSSIKMSLAKTKLTKEKEHNCPSVQSSVLLSDLRISLTEADINLKAPQAEGLVTMSPSLLLRLFI